MIEHKIRDLQGEMRRAIRRRDVAERDVQQVRAELEAALSEQRALSEHAGPFVRQQTYGVER